MLGSWCVTPGGLPMGGSMQPGVCACGMEDVQLARQWLTVSCRLQHGLAPFVIVGCSF
jgi:hypothetical protein